MEIKWIEKERNRNVSGADVSVRIEGKSSKSGKTRTVFIFRNESWMKVSHSEYAKVGIASNKVYFDEANSTGYKLAKSGNTRRLQIAPTLEDWVGDYTLHLDALNRIWYIEKEV